MYDKNKGVVEETGHMHLSSTPVKFLIETNGANFVGIDSVVSPVKRFAGVIFRKVDEK